MYAEYIGEKSIAIVGFAHVADTVPPELLPSPFPEELHPTNAAPRRTAPVSAALVATTRIALLASENAIMVVTAFLAKRTATPYSLV
jgi:hypothetical protein